MAHIRHSRGSSGLDACQLQIPLPGSAVHHVRQGHVGPVLAPLVTVTPVTVHELQR